MQHKSKWVLTIGFVLAMGCGGSSSTGSGTGGSAQGGGSSSTSQDEYNKICDAVGARDSKCGDSQTKVDKEVSQCKAFYSCKPMMRDKTTEDIAKCRRDLACDAKNDTCFNQMYAKYQKESAFVTFNEKCVAKVKECSKSDDNCFVSFLNDSVLQQWTDCLDKPCAQLDACWSDTTKAVAPDCYMFR